VSYSEFFGVKEMGGRRKWSLGGIVIQVLWQQWHLYLHLCTWNGI